MTKASPEVKVGNVTEESVSVQAKSRQINDDGFTNEIDQNFFNMQPGANLNLPVGDHLVNQKLASPETSAASNGGG